MSLKKKGLGISTGPPYWLKLFRPLRMLRLILDGIRLFCLEMQQKWLDCVLTYESPIEAMPKLTVRVLLAAITFGIGLLCVLAVGWFGRVQLSPVIVDRAATYIPALKPRFSPTSRGCGQGYSQGYETNDGERLSEGVSWNPSRKTTSREFQKLVRDAEQVVERIPNYSGYHGWVGERVVLINGPESVSILLYDGGSAYRFIDAPTLSTALEFEQYLISIDFRSPM
jgi:hypothetical protein